MKKKILSVFLVLTLMTTMLIGVNTVNASEFSGDVVARFKTFEKGRGTMNPDGSKKISENNHFIYGMNLTLEKGTYYVKFLAKIQGLDKVANKDQRLTFIDAADKGYDVPVSNLSEFTEDTWKSVVVPIVVDDSRAGQGIEWRLGGALYGDTTLFVGKEIVFSSNDTPLPLEPDNEGVVATFETAQKGRGTMNPDGSKKISENNHFIYGMDLTLAKGTYYVKFLAKIQGLDKVANKDQRVTFIDAADKGYDVPVSNLSEFTEDTWKSVVVPITIDDSRAGQGIQWRLGGALYGDTTLFVGKEIVFSSNDTPLPLETDNKGVVATFETAQKGRGTTNLDGSKKLSEDNHFIYGMDLTLAKGTYYVKFFAKIQGLDKVANKDQRLTFIDAADKGYDVPVSNLSEFTEDTWKSVVVPIVVDDARAGQGIQWRLGGALYAGTTLFVGNKIVFSSNDTPLSLGDKDDLNDIISEAEELYDNAVEGTEPGNYAVGSKAIFKAAIDAAKLIADDADATEAEINNAIATLEAAMSAFEAVKVPVAVDKTALNSAISDAEALYNKAVEGTAVGNYKAGSKATFKAAIDAAKLIADDEDATQEEIDAAVITLNTAKDKFEDAKIVTSNPKTNDIVLYTLITLFTISILSVLVIKKRKTAK